MTLSSRTDPDDPIIISGSYRWIPEVQAALSAGVTEANGGPCEVEFDGFSDDDEDDEPDDDGDEQEEE